MLRPKEGGPRETIISASISAAAAIAVVIAIVVAVKKFLGLPTEQQLDNLKEWLKWAVTQAEKELGSGTGQLKLRMVYDMAVEKFPWLLKIVPFEEFSMWVDEALIWLNKQLESNKAITNMVKGGDDNGKLNTKIVMLKGEQGEGWNKHNTISRLPFYFYLNELYNKFRKEISHGSYNYRFRSRRLHADEK